MRTAKRVKSRDDIAYLLDQIACTYHIEGCYQEARAYFEQEIEFLNDWGTSRANYHLTGAYRGLAGSLRMLGFHDVAVEAIKKSKGYARKTNNKHEQVALLEESRLNAMEPDLNVTEFISSQYSEDIIARIMTISTVAEKLLRSNVISEGTSLLQTAFYEANRFRLLHISENLLKIANKYDLALTDDIKENIR